MPDPKRPVDLITTPPDHPQHEDELLDEAIEESFPASDPVSISIEKPEDVERRAEERPRKRR
jgi:hypothetical protein